MWAHTLNKKRATEIDVYPPSILALTTGRKAKRAQQKKKLKGFK